MDNPAEQMPDLSEKSLSHWYHCKLHYVKYAATAYLLAYMTNSEIICHKKLFLNFEQFYFVAYFILLLSRLVVIFISLNMKCDFSCIRMFVYSHGVKMSVTFVLFLFAMKLMLSMFHIQILFLVSLLVSCCVALYRLCQGLISCSTLANWFAVKSLTSPQNDRRRSSRWHWIRKM